MIYQSTNLLIKLQNVKKMLETKNVYTKISGLCQWRIADYSPLHFVGAKSLSNSMLVSRSVLEITITAW